jgi:glycerate kinase
MKVVIAMDSLKGSLDARRACEAVARGVRRVRPDVEIVVRPMADGGEGTAEAFIGAWGGGDWHRLRVMGPLQGKSAEAGYVWFEDRRCSVVEMALASGLPLLHPSELDPLQTTTFGTGQILKEAMARGGRVLLAAGGSATVDGGVGAAMALGWKFLDEAGRLLELGGGALRRLAAIVPPPSQAYPPMEVLCDTTAPLCGDQGAAPLFAPQKGATPAMVSELAAGLEHLAERIEADLGISVAGLPGGGAAGGLGAGAVAFFGAEIVSGIQRVMDANGLEAALQGAEWVITGEGRFDETSFKGKVVSGVMDLARKAEARIAVLAGSVAVTDIKYQGENVTFAMGIRRPTMSLEYAMEHAEELLEERAAQLTMTL